MGSLSDNPYSAFFFSAVLLTGPGCAMNNPSLAQPGHSETRGHDCPSIEGATQPEGFELAPAEFRAEQVGEWVTIVATGENPTPGWTMKLAQNLTREFPPSFALYRKPPDGIVTQVITRFELCGKFRSREKLQKIRIRGAAGWNEVTITQK